MTWTADDVMHHEADRAFGREVDLGCTECGESWVVHVYADECLTEDQTKCPTRGCNGEGVEL